MALPLTIEEIEDAIIKVIGKAMPWLKAVVDWDEIGKLQKDQYPFVAVRVGDMANIRPLSTSDDDSFVYYERAITYECYAFARSYRSPRDRRRGYRRGAYDILEGLHAALVGSHLGLDGRAIFPCEWRGTTDFVSDDEAEVIYQFRIEIRHQDAESLT